jgi:hypothetical protein
MALTNSKRFMVEVRPGSKEKLDRLCDSMDMIQKGVVSRILDWFFEQPTTIQTEVLNRKLSVDVIESSPRRPARSRKHGVSRSPLPTAAQASAGD